MIRRDRVLSLFLLLAITIGFPTKALALPPEVLNSVVSVLPIWPGHAQAGQGSTPGQTPEGSGVVLRPNLIATAWHVIEPAERIDVRLADGRILPARLQAYDAASDIALLEVDITLAAFELELEPQLAEPVCAIGNSFGLGLSVTCGVVSATGVSNAGFNAVEDFIQTDAAANPGSSGGALVTPDGKLVGMMSAIFASTADTNIGINFAVSARLLARVAEALIDKGAVDYPQAGWRLGFANRQQLLTSAGALVRSVATGGIAERAGVLPGDLITEIEARQIRNPRDVVSAMALLPEGTQTASLSILRDGRSMALSLALTPIATTTTQGTEAKQPQTEAGPDCPYPANICRFRQAVFPVSSFDPVGSATRIGKNLMVTNRHVIGDRMDAEVHTPAGPREGVLVPSDFPGDLVLLKVDGLPDDGFVPNLENDHPEGERFYAIGADIARRQVRVFKPGEMILPPAPDADLGRLHVTARMQPGVSGGAVVNEHGTLVGIAVGGGDGRFEALPLSAIDALLSGQDAESAATETKRLGTAFASCAAAIEEVGSGQQNADDLSHLKDTCLEAANHGQLLEAGRLLAQSPDRGDAIALHRLAVEQVPNSINTRMTLLVSLQLSARFEDMTEHARWLLKAAPDDPQALRFSIQSGVWGGQPDLAEAGYQALLKADPRQAQAARRFIDNAPPAPRPR